VADESENPATTRFPQRLPAPPLPLGSHTGFSQNVTENRRLRPKTHGKLPKQAK